MTTEEIMAQNHKYCFALRKIATLAEVIEINDRVPINPKIREGLVIAAKIAKEALEEKKEEEDIQPLFIHIRVYDNDSDCYLTQMFDFNSPEVKDKISRFLGYVPFKSWRKETFLDDAGDEERITEKHEEICNYFYLILLI
jgi:hypothetical protein